MSDVLADLRARINDLAATVAAVELVLIRAEDAGGKVIAIEAIRQCLNDVPAGAS